MSSQGREVRLAARPTGEPVASDFELADVEVPDPGPGEVLVRNLVMSVDPYMRGRMNDVKSYVPPFQVGAALDGGAVGEVVGGELLQRPRQRGLLGLLREVGRAVGRLPVVRPDAPALGLQGLAFALVLDRHAFEGVRTAGSGNGRASGGDGLEGGAEGGLVGADTRGAQALGGVQLTGEGLDVIERDGVDALLELVDAQQRHLGQDA